MKRTLLVAALVLTAFAAAGCSGSEKKNHPPVAALQASSDGQALNLVNGALNVVAGSRVTFDASGSSDPDGDALTFAWRLVGPSGASDLSESARVEQTFPAGTYNLQLTVRDGKLADVASLPIVAAAAPPGPPVDPPAPVVVFEETLVFDAAGNSPAVSKSVPADGAKLEFQVREVGRLANTQTTLQGPVEPGLSTSKPYLKFTPTSGSATKLELEPVTAATYADANHLIKEYRVAFDEPVAGDWSLSIHGVGSNVDILVNGTLSYA